MLRFSVKHNAPEVLAQLDRYPERITEAVRRATTEATRFMVRHARDTMQERAGGVYWDIDPVTIPTPNGARGSVRTPPSRPHRIEPTKPHGLLVFEINGQKIFVRGGVNHPGSNPLDWLTSLSQRTDEIEDIYADELAQEFGAGSRARSGL